MPCEIGIGETRACGAVEAKGDLGDDVASSMRGVEDAAAIGEVALLVAEGNVAKSFEVEGADLRYGVGNLLTVRPDVLDRRAADAAGNAGEALDTADALLTDGEDEGVPVGAGSRRDIEDIAFGDCLGWRSDGHVEDQAVEASVADEEVAAAAEDEERQVVLASEAHGFDQLGFGGYFAEKTSRTTDAQGGIGREWDMLLNANGGRWHGFESTTLWGGVGGRHWRSGGQDRTIGISAAFTREKMG